MNGQDPLTEAHDRLVRSQTEFSIAALEREKSYHERRLKTLTLAITAMRRELDLWSGNSAALPADIASAFTHAKDTYRRQQPA